MPRFSDKAINIFTIYYYQNFRDPDKYRTIVYSIDIPLDRCFASFCLMRILFYGQRQTEGLALLHEVKNQNSIIEDPLIEILINLWFSLYYHGINSPPVDIDKGKEYFLKATKLNELFKEIDLWERMFIDYWYQLVKLLNKTFKEIENEEIEEIEGLIDLYDKHPDKRFKPDSVTPRTLLGIHLGYKFQFTRAKEILNYVVNIQESDLLKEWACGNLSNIEMMQGNLEESIKYAQLQEKYSRESGNYLTLQWSLDNQSDVYWETKNFDRAKQLLEESLIIRKKQGDDWYTLIGQFNIFILHYNSFRLTKNKTYFSKMQERFEIMTEEFKSSKNITVRNYLTLAEAIINKHGSFLQKGLALQKLKELKSIYKENAKIQLHMLDLLFEELMISEDKEQITKDINELIQELENNQFRNNPATVFDYTSQQMVVARYYYYILQQKDKSFEIYNALIKKLEDLNLLQLMEKVQIDLRKMESELDSWNSILTDKSILERMKESNFNDYLKEGISFLKKIN